MKVFHIFLSIQKALYDLFKNRMPRKEMSSKLNSQVEFTDEMFS